MTVAVQWLAHWLRSTLVNRHWARLVGWVTVCGRVNRLDM